MEDPQSVVDAIVASEEPIKLNNRPLIEGEFSSMMRKLERERKQAFRDANIRENFKYCRKRCRLFKKCSCFKKSYEEQRQCFESQKYLELEKELNNGKTE